MTRHTIKILLAVLFFASSLQLKAQGFWTATNGVYGGTAKEIINHTATGSLVTVTDGGIFRSTDNGSTWTRSVSGIVSTDNVILGLTQDNTGKLYCNSVQRVYSSTDGGLSWTQTTTVTNNFGPYLKVSPANGNIFVTNSSTNQILRSTDNGQTFSATTFSVSNISDIEINSSGQVIVSVSGQSAVYISTNNGVSWTAMSSGTYTGFPAINVNYTYKLATDATGNLYVLTDLGPYRLAAGATAWVNIKGTLTDSFFNGNIFVSGSNAFLMNNNSSKIYTYNGTTWNTGVNYPFAGLGITSFLPKSSTEFYLGITSLGIYKSTNSGIAWTPSSTGIKGFNYSDFYITPNGRLFAAWNNLGYQISLDNGQTWDLNIAGNANRNLFGFVTLSDNSILGYGIGAIRSIDNGNSWAVQNTNQFLTKVVVNGTNLFSYSGSNLLSSTNAGVTWNSAAISGLPTPSKIQVDANNNIYFLASNSIYKVNSGATTAIQLTGVSSVRDFVFVNGSIIALTINGTSWSISTNGGTSWTNQTLTSNFYANQIWAYNSKVWITQGLTSGSSYLTTDGGASWTSNPLLDNSGSLTDIEFRLAGQDIYTYAAVQNSVVHKSTNEIVPPDAPTNLTVTTNLYNYIELIWDDNAINEDKYVIEASVGNNTSYSIVTENAGTFGINLGNATNKAFGAFTTDANTTYFIRVYAKNGAGSSAYSNEVSATTINNCNTTIPDNRSWTATTVAGAGYTPFGSGPYTSSDVSIKLTANSTNILTLSKYVLGIIDPNYQGHQDVSISIIESCGKAYVYQSSDDINDGAGSWNSATKTLVIKWRSLYYYDDFRATTTLVLNATDPIPTNPSLALYPYSNTEVLLNWNQPGFETQYVIQRATVSGGPYVDINVNYPKTSLVDKSLISGSQYFYRIKALNSAGSSAYSPEQSITISNGQFFRPVENSISQNFENQQGASWGDLDGDGDEDIASPSFTNNAGLSVSPIFFENKGSGVFDRRVLSVLINDNDAVSRGINIVDFNNDGKLDMYITRSGADKSDLVLINNGNWNFTRIAITETSGVSTGFRSSAVADYDRDGLLDMFIGNDNGTTTASLTGYLFKNTNGTSFSKITNSSIATDIINARIASWADYDNDGDQDILVSNNNNPFQPLRLYKNNGDGTFTRVVGTAFDSDLIYNARTISWGDIDNDGDLDVYIGLSQSSISTAYNDRLYRNDGNGVFTSLTTSEASANGTATFGSAFGDIDNDGDLDLLVANSPAGVANSGANGIFINNGSGVFTKSSSNELFTNPNTFEIGVAMADFDGDGFLDVYPAKGSTTAIDLPNFLYKNNATPSSSKNWIAIKLEGTTSNKSAIGARVKVITVSPNRTQIREVSSRTGYGSQNSLIQHFGLGSATAISQIEVRWPSGQTQTISNISQLNRILTIKEDFIPPSFTFNPATNVDQVPIGNKLEITLSEPATPVGGKNLIIRKVSATSAPLQTIAITAGVIDANNKVTFTLAANLEFLTQYFISIDAGAYVDPYQNASLAVAATAWTFTTVEEPDLIPPTITFAPISTLPKNTIGSQKFEVIATDNKGIASVTMYYRKITEENFKNLPGLLNAISSKYDFPLSDSYMDEMGMEYYFEAKDAKPNTTRSPVGNTYHHLRLTYGENLKAITIPASSSKTGYKIISVPYDLQSTSVGLVFTALKAPDPKSWRLLKYSQTPQSWVEGFQNIEQGVGYFIISRESATIKLDNSTSPNNTQSSLKSLSLKKGFNLIGNPYNVPISWNEVKSGITGLGELKVYSGGNYSAGDILNEFEGGFVYADNDISVPVKFKTTTGGRKSGSIIGSDLADQEWIVPLKLSQRDNTFNFGGVGMSQKASQSYDDLDDFSPPTLFEKLEIQFDHPEHFMKSFARDVVNTQAEFEWEFKVDAELNEATTLNWENQDFGENTNELYLLDVSRHIIIDMRLQNQYSFDPSKSSAFKIYFGQDLKSKVKPEGIFLGEAFPNPSSRLVNIPFTVSGSEYYQVRLEVYDMTGRKVTTLLDKELKAGFYSTTWDVDQTGTVNGLYAYRLLVRANDKSETYTNRVIINK